MIKIIVVFFIFISIGTIFLSYAEQKCGLGAELIDGACQITDYRVYHAYRITHIENFPDHEKSPQDYIDRYNTEPEYKSWFDSQFPDKSIEEVVGYRETHVEGFPDNSKSPAYYVKRLHLEESYEPWFDKQFPTLQIYNIVGIDQNQYKKIVDSIEISEAEKQAREEIPNPCINIREPKVATEYQGNFGLNDPAYMEAFREAQYQYNQQMQQCYREYQKVIEQRVAELQCGDFEFGKYTPIEDYDLVYDLILNGLNERNLDTSEILVEYKGNVLYENECQSFYKEYQQLGKETERWNESCPDSGSNPNGEKVRYMIDIFNVCRFATLVPVEQSIGESKIVCGTGTIEKNGLCIPEHETMVTEMQQKSSKGGGCLIATATYDSELAPQVQQLRELRDNKLLQTESGTSFMNTFNDFYYSFSPVIADYERENHVFKEIVKIVITPMISSLSILNYVEMSSDQEVLGYGISLILLNIGMYVGIPAVVIIVIRNRSNLSRPKPNLNF